ncbi:MAG: HEPN domain-containing protein [Chromatiales bacterium]
MKARYCMTPFTDEAKRLLRIAGRDYQAFTILRNHPEAELAPTCFHAQQAVEKALKAVLTIKHIDFRRTHDLEELANLLADVGIALPFALRELPSKPLHGPQRSFRNSIRRYESMICPNCSCLSRNCTHPGEPQTPTWTDPFYRASAAKSARRERSPRTRITCPPWGQSLKRSTT